MKKREGEKINFCLRLFKKNKFVSCSFEFRCGKPKKRDDIGWGGDAILNGKKCVIDTTIINELVIVVSQYNEFDFWTRVKIYYVVTTAFKMDSKISRDATIC